MSHSVDQSSLMVDNQSAIISDNILLFSDIKDTLELDIMYLGWHLKGDDLSFTFKTLQLRNIV